MSGGHDLQEFASPRGKYQPHCGHGQCQPKVRAQYTLHVTGHRGIYVYLDNAEDGIARGVYEQADNLRASYDGRSHRALMDFNLFVLDRSVSIEPISPGAVRVEDV